jgi:stress response protein YsnF
LIGALVNLGVPEEEARVYEEGVKRGGTLVTLKAEDARAQAAADIMNRHGAVDIKQRATQWGQGQPAAAAAPYGTTTAGSTATTRSKTMQGNQHTSEQTNYQQQQANRKAGEEIRVPVVEEELRVGKREVETGGVRVEQKVTEKPVREQVELHEEKVNVQRRPTDRPATAADLRSQPGEQSFEVRETREEAVVQKGARVVEEIVVSKEERDRTQTIEDKVRRKDVEVHEIAGHRGDDYSNYENDFRTYHTKTFSNSGSTYDQWSPAYRYGHSLAGDQRYRGKEWSAFESDARRDWESKNPGTWEKMKDAVRYSWERVRQGAHNMTH